MKRDVDRTMYERVVTKAGKEAFVAIYYCGDEGFKEWLFGNHFKKWWQARSTVPVPSCVSEAVHLASVGRVKPTKSIEYEYEGGWPRVKGSEVGEYPPELVRFLQDVLDTFGDFEVKKVIL